MYIGVQQVTQRQWQTQYSSCEPKLSGKKVGLFGSYGWGDGDWMRNWEESCKGAGAALVGEGVICQEEPDDEAVENCKALGKSLA